MLESFYLFIIPLLIVGFYLCFKFIWHHRDIKEMETNAFLDDEAQDNLALAKDRVFDFVDDLRDSLGAYLLVFLHWVLHFFVLFLKFVSDLTDIFYAKARDFFLQTVTKEKKAVSTFWPHLKEYKKEKEAEEEVDADIANK
jgi:hypothetical protein